MVAAYSIAKLTNGEVLREVMSAYQINQVHEQVERQERTLSDAQAFPEMCKRRSGVAHYKQLPHSESLDSIFARDDQRERRLPIRRPTPIARPERRARSASSMMDDYAGLVMPRSSTPKPEKSQTPARSR